MQLDTDQQHQDQDTCGSCRQVVALVGGAFVPHQRQSSLGTSPRCAGSGGSMGSCQTCDGAGLLPPTSSAPQATNCPYCRGTGRTLRRAR